MPACSFKPNNDVAQTVQYKVKVVATGSGLEDEEAHTFQTELTREEYECAL